MLYAIGTKSELDYFVIKAKARRPAATYPAPTVNSIGRYTLSVDAEDWPVLGSLFTVSTAAQAAIS